VSKEKPQDKTAQATGKGPSLSAKGKEHLKALRKKFQASVQGLEDGQRDYERGLERVSDTIQSINEPPREAAFPWWRAILAFIVLIVPVSLSMTGAYLWGEGDNLLQKIVNCGWLVGIVFTASVIFVVPFVLGRGRWSQVKKWWDSWRGEA
jgi:hypothetical protein